MMELSECRPRESRLPIGGIPACMTLRLSWLSTSRVSLPSTLDPVADKLAVKVVVDENAGYHRQVVRGGCVLRQEKDLFGANAQENILAGPVGSAVPDPNGGVPGPNRDQPVADVRDDAFQEVRGANEIGDIRIHRPFVEIARLTDLDDRALVHDDDAVGHDHGFRLVVGHQDERQADGLVQGLELDLHGFPQLGVQGRKRFVQKQDFRVAYQRAGERHPLLLSTRQHVRTLGGLRVEFDHLQRLGRARGNLVPGQSHSLKPVKDVLIDRQMRKQGVVLEHRVHVAPVRREGGDVPRLPGARVRCRAPQIRQSVEAWSSCRSRRDRGR